MLKHSRRIKHTDQRKLIKVMEQLHGTTIDYAVPQEWLDFAPNALECRRRLGALGWEYSEDKPLGEVIFVSDAIQELGLELGYWDDKNEDA